jgi:hypothetical protein
LFCAVHIYTPQLRCDVFYSHAWNEGVYELARNVLASWPDECKGAYICCLSNPQNLDISAVLNHPDGSPFERVLGAEPRPRAMIMLANRNTPIHTRLWCVLEAHVAREKQIAKIRIEGPATQVTTRRLMIEDCTHPLLLGLAELCLVRSLSLSRSLYLNSTSLLSYSFPLARSLSTSLSLVLS